MSLESSERELHLEGSAWKWIRCGVFVFAVAFGEANAATITDNFIGLPPDPFTQQDKTYGAWSGDLPPGFTTLVSTRSGIPEAMISTTFSEIPSFVITTGSMSGLISLPAGPYTILHVTDTVMTRTSDIDGFSNSFLEHILIPEPGSLALLGTGILAAVACWRRRTTQGESSS
jgi:hypothetical protein